MATLPCSKDEYRKAASEFFKKLPGCSVEEAENGYKCLVLMYFGLEVLTDEHVDIEALLIQLTQKKMIEYGKLEDIVYVY